MVCDGLAQHDKNRLIYLLNKYRENVAISVKELGGADVPGMKIKLNSENLVIYSQDRILCKSHTINKEKNRSESTNVRRRRSSSAKH